MATFRYDQGVVESRAPDDLAPGECQQLTGVVYRPGDRRAHKIGGRSSFGVTGGSGDLKTVKLISNDDGTDTILATRASTRVTTSTSPRLDSPQISRLRDSR